MLVCCCARSVRGIGPRSNIWSGLRKTVAPARSRAGGWTDKGLIRESGAQAYGFISRVGTEYGSALVQVQAASEARVQMRNPSSGVI